MTANHAGRSAGNIREDSVEGLTAPPPLRRARIARRQSHLRLRQTQAVEVFPDAREARLVGVKHSEIDIGELGQVRGLAARSGASIQHALTGLDPQKRCRELST